jgi:hypothetical protein
MTDVCYMSDDDDFVVNGSESEDEDAFSPAPSKNVLQETTNQTSSGVTTAKRTKAVEETYQKLTPHEVSVPPLTDCLFHMVIQTPNIPLTPAKRLPTT